MSAEQVASVLQLQRLKLFSKLDIQLENTNGNICCNYSLADSEEDLELVENCFEAASSLTVTEKTNLFYISGYVARKEGIPCSTKNLSNLPESKFTELLTRGRLSFPPNHLYGLSSQYIYTFFKLRKSCKFINSLRVII